MTEIGLLQIFFYLLILLALVKPLGWYIISVYEGKAWGLHYLGAPLEKFIYRLCGIKPKQDMDWKRYLSAMLVFNLFGLLAVYLIQRLQTYLPLNPQQFIAPPHTWHLIPLPVLQPIPIGNPMAGKQQ